MLNEYEILRNPDPAMLSPSGFEDGLETVRGVRRTAFNDALTVWPRGVSRGTSARLMEELRNSSVLLRRITGRKLLQQSTKT
jgi:hypothetical protein